MAVGGGLGTLVVVVLAMLFGGDPGAILNQIGGGAQTAEAPTAHEQELASFVKVVLADTEDVWTDLFSRQGQRYEMPQLVYYRESTDSACGTGQKQMGPFYCPADRKVYLDLSFYGDLKNKYGAPGDFALAYVVAHEVGHHVQNLLGFSDKVHRMRGRVSDEEYNRLSVRLELQADFLAGVWAHHAQRMKNVLEAGDVEEALGAASAVGDDRLQKRSRGYVVPDSFTHGTSAQRARWFRRGLESGDLSQGDTFNVPYEGL
jgi:predicted metalloprotease